MDLAVRIFREAQRYIIGRGNERITEALLEYAASNAIRASKIVVDNLRRESSIALLKRNRQATLREAGSDLSGSQEKALVAVEQVTQAIPGDLSRPQHPEFTDALSVLLDADDLYERIIDPDLFQRASGGRKPLEQLRKAGIFCENPLEVFA